MSRPLGGYIGYDGEPATTAAPGIWTLREAEFYQRKAQWPLVFAPDQLTGLQLWLDASDDQTLYDATTGGSLVAADGGVARWEDKSGNDYHMTQATAGSRPLRKASATNGLDVLRFDGTDDILEVPSSTGSFKYLHYGSSTVFIVVKCGTTANPDAAYTIMQNGNLSQSFSIAGGWSVLYDDRNSSSRNDGLLTVVASGESGGSVSAFSDNVFTANQYGLMTHVTDTLNATAANRHSLRINGGSELKTNASTGTADDVNAHTNLTVGARAGDLLFPLDGDMCEIIIYDSALSDTNRELVENYLIEKWGIS